MKNIIYILGLVVVSMFVTSCEENLTEFNTDPNNPTDVDVNLILPQAVTQAAFNEGLNPNRVAGIIMQQFRGLEAQQAEYTDYVIKADAMNNYWNTALYSGVLRSCNNIINKATERPFYSGVAKIIMANELGKATSYFGDIPYSQAFLGTDNLKPAYDSQESIYSTVQTLLSEGISEVTGGGYFGGDLVYGGDATSWVKLAHGLKARYYMHTGERLGTYGDALAEAGMSFASNAEAGGFQFQSSEVANWSLAKFAIERPATLGITDQFAEMMTGDPRFSKYIAGDAGSYTFFDAADGELTWGRSDARVPLMSFVEVEFIKAEAKQRAGMDATADLASGIAASMELSGATDDGYVEAASADGSLENIMTEAYKAYYGFNFHETWANWRRTGFPTLAPNPAPAASNGFNPSGVIPRRYLYTQDERQTNRESVEAAESAQGGDLLDVGLWAF